MGPKPANTTAAPQTLPPLPRWIVSVPAEHAESAAFRSGAALAHLGVAAAAADGLPRALWRDSLALAAAEVCAGLAGRREGAGALRDALHLTKPGDDPGPGGRVLRQWSRAVARPLSQSALLRALEGTPDEDIAVWLNARGATPVDRAAQVIEAVLEGKPRAETEALILAEAVLARAMGWDHLVPLLVLEIKARDLRLRGDDLRLACHRAAVGGAAQALSLAADLTRRSARLRAVAPKLRAREAERAVDLFLSRNAVAPGEMTFMSDRAARRLCDRLVALGAVRELTGRDTFRLYGL
jgi:hypothetical protein